MVNAEHIFYIDDRDFGDADSDEVAGGIWIYKETHKHSGLQRGGTQFAVEAVNPHAGTLPHIPPTKVTTPALPVVGPQSQTLFPNGFGGGDLATFLGSKDECKTIDPATGKPLPPDFVIF